MRLRKFLCAALVALFSVQMLAVPAFADEGMWPINNIPKSEIKRKYGFDVTDAWLKKVQMSAVRFNNGGSGSFVSAEGLVLTNYHIVEDFVGELSTPQKDYAKDGFVARTRADEMKIPSLELNVLVSVEDVAERVNAAVKPEMSASDAFTARRAAVSGIEAESLKATGLRSDVVTLYQGGQYNLYRYKKYTDVRLVFVPEFQAAFFGGDPDNFNFPRFNIDMALVRVYENDEPVKVENYLKWSQKGAKENELVFVMGHPGSTSRLNTVAHLEELRDHSIPLLIRFLERRENVLKTYMAMGDEQTRQGQNELNSIQNSLKVYRGQIAGLQDKKLIDDKRRSEEALRKSIAADPRRQKEYGDAWDSIATAHKSLASFVKERRFLDLGAGFGTTLFGVARTLVRLAAENEKPNAQRLPEFTDARRASLELSLYSTAPINIDLEKLKLADSLAFMVEAFGAEVPMVNRVLDSERPEARAAALIDGTMFNDVAFRRQPLVSITDFSRGRSIVGFATLLRALPVLSPPSARLRADSTQVGADKRSRPAPKKSTRPKKTAAPVRTTRSSTTRTTRGSGGDNATTVEIAFWNSIKDSTNPDDYRVYLEKYPDGQFVGLAQNRITSLEAPTRTTRGSGGDNATTVEVAFWNSIKDSTNPDDYRVYLEKYPDGQFVGLAQNRITSLEAPTRRNEKRPSMTNVPPAIRTVSADYSLVRRVLNDKTPEARAAELIDGTKLTDVAFRRQLAAGGRQAIESSTDPMIVLARSIDKEARDLRKRYEDEVIGVERVSYAKIARALFETEGTKLYPDATFTLRLSYGAVKGYQENGKKVEPFTTLGGLYDRSVKFSQKFPYNLPPRWMEKKSVVNSKTPFNFVSTNDIIGGNSGSPTVNKDAELVGLIFDGNIQSLVGNFYYDEAINRAISVDSRGMLEILRKVFGANEVADELTK